MSKILRFSIITPVKKGAREMILTFLDFFRRGLPTHKKISFLGGPAHFVTYGDGDGLVDNNNALTTMASALKSGRSTSDEKVNYTLSSLLVFNVTPETDAQIPLHFRKLRAYASTSSPSKLLLSRGI
jgi:hypothetical protein